MRTTCEGEYVTPSGQNITIGDSPPPPNGTHKVVDSCSSHSALNPLGLIRILFEIGIFFTGLALLVAIWTTVRFSRKKALLNCIVSVAALSFLGLATILTHGLSVAASKLLNLLGSGIGLKTEYGGKFIALAWATVILMLVNIGLWVVLGFWGENLSKLSRKKKNDTLPNSEKGHYLARRSSSTVRHEQDVASYSHEYPARI